MLFLLFSIKLLRWQCPGKPKGKEDGGRVKMAAPATRTRPVLPASAAHRLPTSSPTLVGASPPQLAPTFKKDGVVTAAAASGICDGAGALVLASEVSTL